MISGQGLQVIFMTFFILLYVFQVFYKNILIYEHNQEKCKCLKEKGFLETVGAQSPIPLPHLLSTFCDSISHMHEQEQSLRSGAAALHSLSNIIL